MRSLKKRKKWIKEDKWMNERTSEWVNEQIEKFPSRLLNCQKWLIRMDVFVGLFAELHIHTPLVHTSQLFTFGRLILLLLSFIFIYLLLILFWLFFCFCFCFAGSIFIRIWCAWARTSGKVVAIWPNTLSHYLRMCSMNVSVCVMGVIVSCVSLFFVVKAPIFFSAFSQNWSPL